VKKIILITFFACFVGFFLQTSYSDEETCMYTAKIKQCVGANENWTSRSIEEFPCIEWTKEEIAYQVILDEKFSIVDDNVNIYLIALENNKSKYFWPDAESNYIEAVDEIESKFSIYWEFWKQYNNFCWIEIIKEYQSCNKWETSITKSSKFFDKSTCMLLAETKLHIYRQVSYDILMLNKLRVREDSAKEHLQQERIKYDELLDSMMINSWYMERISKKWPSKLKNTH